jgi:hypothetical protein
VARLKELAENVIPGSIRNEKHPSGAEPRVNIDELSGTTEELAEKYNSWVRCE